MKKPKPGSPPAWARKFFRWYCPAVLLEETEGDLLENYEYDIRSIGLRKARRRYIWNVIRFCNPTTFQKARKYQPHRSAYSQTIFPMFRNNLRIFLRNARLRPLYAILNILGLTLGITTALLILLYLQFELNFDQYHEKKDRIVKLNTEKIQTKSRLMDVDWEGVPGNLGPYIHKDLPEVESFFRAYGMFENDQAEFRWEDRKILIDEVPAVDHRIFDVFTFQMLKGDPESALSGPGKMVISASTARKLFGTADPMGKIIMTASPTTTATDSVISLVISGVYEDMPRNSHLFMNAMVSAETDPQLNEYYFNRFGFQTYLLLHPDVNLQALEEKIPAIYDTYLDPEREPVLVRAHHRLIPIGQLHLRSTGGRSYLEIFAAIGLLVLFISAISYVNISTARAGKRAVEVGIRKVLGSGRLQLIGQFLMESTGMTVVALSISLALVVYGIDILNETLDLHLSISQLANVEIIMGLLAIVALLGIIGGSYPAFFLSSFHPAGTLKGMVAHPAGQKNIQKILVTFQVAAVVFVLISTGMIYLQLDFIRNKDLGFDHEMVLRLNMPSNIPGEKAGVFKHRLEEIPKVASVGSANFLPGTNMIQGPVSVETSDGPVQAFTSRGRMDEVFLNTMSIQITAGRGFSPDFPTDTTKAMLINETLADQFGLINPLGTKIRLGDHGNPHFYEVIGVVEDFHQGSLHEILMPQIFMLGNHPLPYLLVKVSGDPKSALNDLEKEWGEVFPSIPFSYEFMDEAIARNYLTDQIRGRLFLGFSMLTFIIAFLGLFGLSAYLSSLRIKEIGIRKILGAGSWSIIYLFTRKFLILTFIAAIPGILLAWYFVGEWLKNFAFRVEMNFWVVLLVVIFTFLLTFITTGTHAFLTARQNPADALRNE